ncbi:MAG: hypothetical protein FJX61_12005 [Alphaproteobacteria bacterium]|nr:hypothetical protein [Alphaproteobacteria bacterium]
MWASHLAKILNALLDADAKLVAFGGTLAYRFGVTDRDRRRTMRAFALYLPAAVIERALALREGPTLGGEEREVSILFSDIANYARLAEKLELAALVTALNEYFATVTGLIKAHGGFVDKFIATPRSRCSALRSTNRRTPRRRSRPRSRSSPTAITWAAGRPW